MPETIPCIVFVGTAEDRQIIGIDEGAAVGDRLYLPDDRFVEIVDLINVDPADYSGVQTLVKTELIIDPEGGREEEGEAS